MNIGVVGGAGYVGLVTGLGLAEIGHHVINVDLDVLRIGQLNSGQSPIYEDGIEPLLKKNISTGHIRFTTELETAIIPSDVIFIAVGTPSGIDGQADLSQVIQAVEGLVTHLNNYKVIVLKSTVPVGTVDLVRDLLSKTKREGEGFDIVANPEFLREGKGLRDFFYPDRIVVGTHSGKAQSIMRELYKPIIQHEVIWIPSDGAVSESDHIPLIETDINSAQMIKYASNAFLATRLSFINEIAGLSERVGADIKEVALGMGYDPRIGHSYLNAGLGFGGPCLEKDLLALIKIAERNDYSPILLKSTLERNDKQVETVISKIKELTGNVLYKKIVAVLGLAFKANTNDVRDSMALKIIDRLEREGAVVRAHDPLAIQEAKALRANLICYEDPYDAMELADILLILTEWQSFTELDYSRAKKRMAYPCIVDTRNILDPETIRAKGFTYVGMGRL
jgi:UDPglucose 6-dehydrogenase